MRDRIDRRFAHLRNNQHIRVFAHRVAERSNPLPGVAPVVFFNASTRLEALSQNAAFSLLTSWSLLLQGIPVHQFFCESGMTRCVLGTNRDDVSVEPPCRACMNQSKVLFDQVDRTGFGWLEDNGLEHQLENLDLGGMMQFQYADMPLGELVLPSVRWTLRRHNLADDKQSIAIFRQFIKSAWNVARQFDHCLDELKPQCVVVFNGQFFPEATVRNRALSRGIRVISHEVALQPLSGYFTDGEATAYPINIPDTFQLSPEQNERLDEYLTRRFQGEFSMAGIRFWPEMKPLSPEFWEKANAFKQIVPIFTNVVFDTSQGHANVLYPHMFSWLDDLVDVIKKNPDTYFVIRAHPDEGRAGKESRESVEQWVINNGLRDLANVLFVNASEPFSSYELIQKSKFILVYNSTIGLEASIMGLPVLCAGKARFTQLPTVFFPATRNEYLQTLNSFLTRDEIAQEKDHQKNARRFLYYQLYRTSLPFDQFIEEDGIWRGYVKLKKLNSSDLLPENSETMRILRGGLIDGKSFLLEE